METIVCAKCGHIYANFPACPSCGTAAPAETAAGTAVSPPQSPPPLRGRPAAPVPLTGPTPLTGPAPTAATPPNVSTWNFSAKLTNGALSCPSCAAAYPMSAETCPRCSTPNPLNAIPCPNCRTPYRWDVATCPSCGSANPVRDVLLGASGGSASAGSLASSAFEFSSGDVRVSLRGSKAWVFALVAAALISLLIIAWLLSSAR